MYRRALCWAALAVALPAFALAASERDPVKASAVAYPQVKQVVCHGGRGSAFLTERGWASVAHVTSQTGCAIDGTAIGSKQEDGDFSRVDHAVRGKGFKINCGGFVAGQWYWAVGYANGFEWQTMTRILATWKDADDGMRMLWGPPVIPGMSGGPILNAAGEVVGTVNAYSKEFPVSFSRALKDTSLCR